MLAGCANRGYFPPTQSDFSRAAKKAVTDPATVAPAVGSAVFLVSGADKPVSDWARRETPVFGSNERAREASNLFRASARTGMQLSALLPTDQTDEYWVPMVERQLVQNLGAGLALQIREPIVSAVARPRPRSGRPTGYPSGHATRAFSTVASSFHNMKQTDLPGYIEKPFLASQVGFGVATAWARVEYGAHYPADVLGGWALGNVVSVFLNELLLAPGETTRDESIGRIKPDAFISVSLVDGGSVGAGLTF